MIRNSIVAKLWLTIVAMVIVVLALLSIMLQQFFVNYVYQEESRQLVQIAQRVDLLLARDHSDVTIRAAQDMAHIQQSTLLIAIPATTNPQLTKTMAQLTPSQQQAFAVGQPVQVQGTGHQPLVVYMRIPAGSTYGILQVTLNQGILDAPINGMRQLVIFATVLGMVLATGLAFVISKNLSRPLLQMNQVAEEMARGNFDGQINVVTRDEVGRLGKTFNALTAQLKFTIDALSIERDQLTSILLTLQDCVIAVDLQGRVLLANPPALHRLRDQWLAETGIPETARLPREMQQMLITVIEENRSINRDFTVMGRQLAVSMAPLYESDGESLRGAVTVMRDVTEERRIDRLRKDLLANVSHELRTPLSMMQGYTEALLDEFWEDRVQRRELTEIIHDETLRMRRLVNDVLDLAQLESSQFRLSFSFMDLTSLVRRVGRKFHALAGDQGVTLIVDVQPMPPTVVRADEDRLEQVFTNLLDNAIRHTPYGGRVVLSGATSHRHAQILVTDSGGGISEEDLPYIWDRFYKGDKARTRGNAGTGLGLAITRHIVLAHGGNIIVQSSVGDGTTFTVSLPLADTSPSTSASSDDTLR